MARKQNELSAIQQEAPVFAGIKAQISRFTPDYLATLGNVSRTTIFKYQRREAVNPKSEKEILRVIKEAETNKQTAAEESIAEAKSLIHV